MTSRTISVNFDDTEQKTVFTATERCILKLVPTTKTTVAQNIDATFKLNSTNIGKYYSSGGAFSNVNKGLASLLSFSTASGTSDYHPSALILYLEKGDTIYATRTSGDAYTAKFYSAVFTF